MKVGGRKRKKLSYARCVLKLLKQGTNPISQPKLCKNPMEVPEMKFQENANAINI